MKRTMSKRAQGFGVTHLCNQTSLELQKEEVFKSRGHLYRSISCPCLRLSTKCQSVYAKRSPSALSFKDIMPKFRTPRCVLLQIPVNFIQVRTASTSSAVKNLSSVCSCPCPPCGCNCLPPPCNTPAKCLQYMTGYYYYPYGTWFCGPYHISTGACGPCAGPVRPDGCCGPAAPCPGGPCGPPCIGPCKSCGPCICGPCGSCGPCGACCGPLTCGPLTCCGVYGVGNPFQNFATGNPYDCYPPFNALGAYGHYGPNMFHNQYMYQNYNTPFNSYPPYPQYGQFNMPPPHFGPCYDVPMPMPIPIDGNFPHNPFIPTHPPSSPPPSPGRPTFTFSKPTIKDIPTTENMRSAPSIDGPCPKNLSPQSLRMSPLSRYENSLKMNSSNRPPRMMARALPEPNLISVCHFSTKSMQKYETDDCKPEIKDDTNVSNPNNDKKCKETCNKPFCYWCFRKGRYN